MQSTQQPPTPCPPSVLGQFIEPLPCEGCCCLTTFVCCSQSFSHFPTHCPPRTHRSSSSYLTAALAPSSTAAPTCSSSGVMEVFFTVLVRFSRFYGWEGKGNSIDTASSATTPGLSFIPIADDANDQVIIHLCEHLPKNLLLHNSTTANTRIQLPQAGADNQPTVQQNMPV